MATPHVSCLVLCLIAAAPIASAATVDGNWSAAVVVGTNGEFAAFDELLGPTETLLVSDSRSIAAAGPFGTGTAAAQYSVNGVTGQLRLGIDAKVDATPNGERGFANPSINLTLAETFRLTGSGTITVGMALSADWSATDFYFGGCTTYNASAMGGSFNSDCVTHDILTDFSTGSVANELVTVSFDAPEGTDGTFEVIWRLFAQLNVGGELGPSEAGFIDALNTANIFVATEGDVVVSPVTAMFLSDPAFGGPVLPTVVPLPASGVLLLGGLLLGACIRRKVTVRAKVAER